MADEGVFATTTECTRKAGAGASATATAEAFVNDFVAQAESLINCMTRFNWSDAYSGLDADNRDLLKEAASNLAAIYIISYDMGGYTSRSEAESMINLLRDAALRAISILRDKKTKVYINGS
tara:strand:+ start:2098 stop:2463 length:366 start_codon:yes stop_codon:yes gene_type:complete